MKRIISFTSIPSRFPALHLTIESLLAQDADDVYLCIPEKYHRFPEWDGELPRVPREIRILRCRNDYGPATKILPVANLFRNQDCQLLFCDDDCIVPKGWANRLFKIQERRPHQVVATYGRRSYPYSKKNVIPKMAREVPVHLDLRYRLLRLYAKAFSQGLPYRRPIYRSGYCQVFFGVGGVVVRPNFFDDIAYNIPDIAWYVDDIWLSAAMARQGIDIFCPLLGCMPQHHINSDVDDLCSSVINGHNRKELNIRASEHCRHHYGIW